MTRMEKAREIVEGCDHAPYSSVKVACTACIAKHLPTQSPDMEKASMADFQAWFNGMDFSLSSPWQIAKEAWYASAKHLPEPASNTRTDMNAEFVEPVKPIKCSPTPTDSVE